MKFLRQGFRKLSYLGRRMRAFSCAWSLPVTWQRWPSNYSIRRSRKYTQTWWLHCYSTGVMGDRILHCRNRDFGRFRLLWPWPPAMTFIYELDPYCVDLYQMCKYELSTSRGTYISTSRQTESTEIIQHTASRVLKNMTVAPKKQSDVAIWCVFSQTSHLRGFVTCFNITVLCDSRRPGGTIRRTARHRGAWPPARPPASAAEERARIKNPGRRYDREQHGHHVTRLSRHSACGHAVGDQSYYGRASSCRRGTDRCACGLRAWPGRRAHPGREVFVTATTRLPAGQCSVFPLGLRE